MASPQIEDGFTKIANEILEHTARASLNGTQLRILLIVWRYTYGFGRKSHELSISFLANAIDAHEKQVQRELSKLIRQGILIVTATLKNKNKVLAFEKNYDSWVTDEAVEPEAKQLISSFPFNEAIQLISGDQGSELVANLTSNPLPKKERKKILKKKDIYTESSDLMAGIPYQKILDYLNLKAGKKFTVNSKPTIAFINGRFKEGRTLEDFIRVIDVKVAQWLDDPKMNEFLRPATLFNATNFESYLNQKMPVKQLSKAEQGNEEMLAMYRRAEDEENGDSQTLLCNLEGIQELRED